MSGAVARATDLRLFHLDDIGPHYATTLRLWRENLFRNLEGVRARRRAGTVGEAAGPAGACTLAGCCAH